MAEFRCCFNTRKGLRVASTKPFYWGLLFVWLSMNGLAYAYPSSFFVTDPFIWSAIGKTVKLPCRVLNMDNVEVLWKDSDNNVISKGERIHNGDSRFHVLHLAPHDWYLKIENLKEEDFGSYTCVLNTNPVKTRTVHLTDNYEAPRVYQDMQRIGDQPGHNMELTCSATGQPSPEIDWLWLGKRIVDNYKYKVTASYQYQYQTNSTLMIRDLSRRDYGFYTCVGWNQGGATSTIFEIFIVY